jgi:hypothetical protein
MTLLATLFSMMGRSSPPPPPSVLVDVDAFFLFFESAALLALVLCITVVRRNTKWLCHIAALVRRLCLARNTIATTIATMTANDLLSLVATMSSLQRLGKMLLMDLGMAILCARFMGTKSKLFYFLNNVWVVLNVVGFEGYRSIQETTMMITSCASDLLSFLAKMCSFVQPFTTRFLMDAVLIILCARFISAKYKNSSDKTAENNKEHKQRTIVGKNKNKRNGENDDDDDDSSIDKNGNLLRWAEGCWKWIATRPGRSYDMLTGRRNPADRRVVIMDSIGIHTEATITMESDLNILSSKRAVQPQYRTVVKELRSIMDLWGPGSIAHSIFVDPFIAEGRALAIAKLFEYMHDYQHELFTLRLIACTMVKVLEHLQVLVVRPGELAPTYPLFNLQMMTTLLETLAGNSDVHQFPVDSYCIKMYCLDILGCLFVNDMQNPNNRMWNSVYMRLFLDAGGANHLWSLEDDNQQAHRTFWCRKSNLFPNLDPDQVPTKAFAEIWSKQWESWILSAGAVNLVSSPHKSTLSVPIKRRLPTPARRPTPPVYTDVFFSPDGTPMRCVRPRRSQPSSVSKRTRSQSQSPCRLDF